MQFRDPYDPCIYPLRLDPIITPDDFLFLAHVKKEKSKPRLPTNPTEDELDMYLARKVGFNPYLTYEDYIPFASCRPLSPDHEGSSSGDETVINGENNSSETPRIFPPLPPEPVRETPPPLPATSPPQSPKNFDPKSRSPTPQRNLGKRDEPIPPSRSYQPSRNRFPTISGQFDKSYRRPTQFFRENRERPARRERPSYSRYPSPQRENLNANRYPSPRRERIPSPAQARRQYREGSDYRSTKERRTEWERESKEGRRNPRSYERSETSDRYNGSDRRSYGSHSSFYRGWPR